MEKKIEDYLHLYIGQPIATAEERYNSPGLKMIGLCDLGVQCRDEGIKLTYYVLEKDVKLVLRPLFTMTNEEHEHWKNMAKAERKMLPMYTDMDFHAFHYLLKQGFDLFGLIESGLAIDKTTTPPLNNR